MLDKCGKWRSVLLGNDDICLVITRFSLSLLFSLSVCNMSEWSSQTQKTFKLKGSFLTHITLAHSL